MGCSGGGGSWLQATITISFELPDRTGWLPDGWKLDRGGSPDSRTLHACCSVENHGRCSLFRGRARLEGRQGDGLDRQRGPEGRSAGRPAGFCDRESYLPGCPKIDLDPKQACDVISRLGFGRGREISWLLISMRPLDWAAGQALAGQDRGRDPEGRAGWSCRPTEPTHRKPWIAAGLAQIAEPNVNPPRAPVLSHLPPPITIPGSMQFSRRLLDSPLSCPMALAFPRLPAGDGNDRRSELGGIVPSSGQTLIRGPCADNVNDGVLIHSHQLR